jgi:hypothetical protein
MQFKTRESGGEYLHAEGFGVSWRPRNSVDDAEALETLGMMSVLLGGSADVDAPPEGETALVDDQERNDGKRYYVLNGDWREQYIALAPKGFDACLEFYNKQAVTHRSEFSDA